MNSSPARACGLDFGTSNSTVGWLRPGQTTLLALEDGKTTLPSAIFFNADEGHMRFGRAALAEYLEGYEGRLMRALKSLLGSSLIDNSTEVLGRQLPYRELLRQFIAELKARAEHSAGRQFDYAVFGRPVHFVDDDAVADQRAEQTLGDIARAVGFREIHFQYEPIAAALHYEQSLTREELVLITDIGGGTADFSLLRLSPQRAARIDRREDVLANAGVHIGGTDFDRALSLAVVMPLLGLRSRKKSGIELPSGPFFKLATWHLINFCYTRAAWNELQEMYRDSAERDKLDRLLNTVSRRAGHWLALQVEEAKIALSTQASTVMNLDHIAKEAESLQCSVDAKQLDEALAGQLQGIENSVRELLSRAGVNAAEVDTLYFTGGSSGVSALRQRVAALLPRARSLEGDLFGSIGAGLAVDASRRFA